MAKAKPEKKAVRKKAKGGSVVGSKYSKEAVYFWYTEANGNVLKAIAMAKEMGATDVPKANKTWYNCINKCDFAGKLAKEREEYYKRFHLRREKKRQHMLDQVAEAMEPVIESFGLITSRMADALKEKEVLDVHGTKIDPFEALREVLSIDGFDKMFRMYLRAMGEPEKISKTNHEVRATTIMNYEDAAKQKKNAIQGQVVLTPESAQEATVMAQALILDGEEWSEKPEGVESKPDG